MTECECQTNGKKTKWPFKKNEGVHVVVVLQNIKTTGDPVCENETVHVLI